jgi:mannose-6-phosphate isomerase-like protein (cupin superfamily)
MKLKRTKSEKQTVQNAGIAARGPFVRNLAEIPWQEYPGHFGGALSKALVRPETCGSRRIDFRISSYQPMAYVQEHVHRVQEQVYHVLEGEGMLTLDDRSVLLRRNDYVFVPPGVRHGFTNNGLGPLVFLVVTTPVEDEEAPL